MPDHNHITVFRVTFRLVSLSLLAAALLLTGVPTPSQGRDVESVKKPPTVATAPPEAPSVDLPAAIPGTTWRALGVARTATIEQMSDHPDAGLYGEYGLKRRQSRTYAQKNARLTIETDEMHYPSGAYGLQTFRRHSTQDHHQYVQRGRYLVSLTISPTDAPIDAETVQAIGNLFNAVEPGELPTLTGHLPERDRIAGTETYIVGPKALGRREPFEALRGVVNFDGGADIAAAEYNNGSGRMSLLIVEHHTPQTATDGHQAIQAYVGGLSSDEQAKQILKRVGNYIVLATNVTDRASAQTIVDEVKYTFGVYWEGRKFTSIPLQYRPPDPYALEEATETAKVLLQTFYGIGVLIVAAIICGIFAGWAVFFWRRQKRRRLGLDNSFSDAGETVRLNLDDYVLQSGEQQIKLLGKGDA